jgi:hypothetical protein
MEELALQTATYGFPMVTAFFLLVRFEKRLAELTSAINKMCYYVERMEGIEDEREDDVVYEETVDNFFRKFLILNCMIIKVAFCSFTEVGML